MVVAKRRGREKHTKMEQRKAQGPVSTSGETNSPPGSPNLHRGGSGRGEEKKIQKEEPKFNPSLVFGPTSLTP